MPRDTQILVYAPCYSDRETPKALRVLRAIPGILRSEPTPPIEAAHWPTSVDQVSVHEDELIVWWANNVAVAAFSWAFDKAWAELGDARTITHCLSEEMTDDDIPF